jgi:hypothetical protein
VRRQEGHSTAPAHPDTMASPDVHPHLSRCVPLLVHKRNDTMHLASDLWTSMVAYCVPTFDLFAKLSKSIMLVGAAAALVGLAVGARSATPCRWIQAPPGPPIGSFCRDHDQGHPVPPTHSTPTHSTNPVGFGETVCANGGSHLACAAVGYRPCHEYPEPGCTPMYGVVRTPPGRLFRTKFF